MSPSLCRGLTLLVAVATIVAAARAIAGCPPPPEVAPFHGEGDPRPAGEPAEGGPKPLPGEGEQVSGVDPSAGESAGNEFSDGVSAAQAGAGDGSEGGSPAGGGGPLADAEDPVPFPLADEPGGKVEIGGVVRDQTTGKSVGGVSVTVPGAAEATAATASEDGRFRLSINTGERLALRFEAPTYMTTQMELLEPANAMEGEPYFFPMLPLSYLEQNLAKLGLPELEPGKGAVLLDFDRGVVATASLSATGQGSMAIDSNGIARKGAKLGEGKSGSILFVNVSAGTTAVNLHSVGDACKVVNDVFDDFEVTPDTVSAIAVECGGG